MMQNPVAHCPNGDAAIFDFCKLLSEARLVLILYKTMGRKRGYLRDMESVRLFIVDTRGPKSELYLWINERYLLYLGL